MYNSTGACPSPAGPCACTPDAGAPGHFLYSCRPWAANRFPFGSEFAWDSTGQEEIYAWGRRGLFISACAVAAVLGAGQATFLAGHRGAVGRLGTQREAGMLAAQTKQHLESAESQPPLTLWRRHFGLDQVAATALDAILAFTPCVPNFAYNGAALGIGDFSNNAKETPYGGWERVLQHYRAGAT